MTTVSILEPSAEPSLSWFRGARVLEPIQINCSSRIGNSGISVNCIHGLRYPHCGFCLTLFESTVTTPPRERDYSPEAVEERNPRKYFEMSYRQIKVNRFVRLMNKRGFRDYADSYSLPESLSRDLFKPPTAPSVPTSKYRVPAQVASNHMPSIGGQTRFQSGVFSIRVKTEWATDHALSAIKPLFNRSERPYNGQVVNAQYCPITCRPSSSEQSRLEIDPKLFKSKFAPSPLKRLAGERIHDEVFEPTTSDIQKWKNKHTKDGKFKQKSYGDLKFNSRRPNWEFRNGADEIQPSGHVSADRSTFIFDSETDFETAAEIAEQKVELDATDSVVDEGNPYKITRSGKWTRDPDFVREITKMFPTQRLPVYVGPVPEHLLHPQFFRSSFATIRHVLSEYKHEVEPTGDGDRLQDAFAEDRQGFIFKINSLLTAAQKNQREQLLKNAEDFDRDKHRLLAHLYEYGYRYYPEEPRNLHVQEVWNTVRETTIDTGIDSDDRDSWNDTIENTFGDPIQLPMGDLTAADVVPQDGFYIRTKISLNSPAWAYLVLPLRHDSLFEDDGEGLEETDAGFESPVPVGLPGMQANLREQADQSRSRKKQETIRRRLREAFSDGDIALVRFRLVGDRLAWDVTRQNSITAN